MYLLRNNNNQKFIFSGVISANRRPLNSQTQSYIPNIGLPPAAKKDQGELIFDDTERPIALNDPETMFAINPNLFLYVKKVYCKYNFLLNLFMVKCIILYCASISGLLCKT